MPKLTPDQARNLWTEALRSGEYHQGKNYLHQKSARGDEFCCLGVACDIAVKNGVELDIDTTYHIVRYDKYSAALPTAVAEWLGVQTSFGDFYNNGEYGSLTNLNDHGVKFAEIADTIESKPSGLFRD